MERSDTDGYLADEWSASAHLREMLMLRGAELLGVAELILYPLEARARTVSQLAIP